MSLLPLTLAQALRESCTELRPLDSEKPRTFRVAAPCPPFRTATDFEIKHDGFRFICLVPKGSHRDTPRNSADIWPVYRAASRFAIRLGKRDRQIVWGPNPELPAANPGAKCGLRCGYGGRNRKFMSQINAIGGRTSALAASRASCELIPIAKGRYHGRPAPPKRPA
jgi:hypothetical protein